MKILHLMLGNFFIDNYSYQENLLTKFHKKSGYDVEIIASLFNFDESGEGYYENKRREYINENKIPVTRLEYKVGIHNKKLRRYVGTYEAIKKATPDIIFIHGCQFMDIDKVVKYLEENQHVKVYVDNHADFSNSATNWLSKNVLHKIIWRRCAHLIEPFTEKFYGVLPARVDFLKNIYKINPSKVELLTMGADDDLVNKINRDNSRKKIRNKYKIEENDFLIITGGKIDLFKRQILNLMEIMSSLNKNNVKLIVFGSVVQELKDDIARLSQSPSIKYIGWINNEESYELFNAADLLVFPGRHSVYWEQAVGMGVPMIAKYWNGTTHMNHNNNCIFLKNDSKEELGKTLLRIINDDKQYSWLLKNAQSESKKQFLYSEIARKSIK